MSYASEIERLARAVEAGQGLYEAVAASRYVNQPLRFRECMDETMYPDEADMYLEALGESELPCPPVMCFFAMVCDLREALDNRMTGVEFRMRVA